MEIRPRRPGVLLILSAPSGAGKSTLASLLRERRGDVEVSVSHTTRPVRGAEVDGIHYHFVSRERFQELIGEGAFAEYAEVYGNFYGTSRKAVDGILQRGNTVILDIDTQGGDQLMDSYPDAVSVFVVPPSMRALRDRLTSRSTESEESLQIRLSLAKSEIEASGRYTYVVVNDDLEQALGQLEAILESEYARRRRMLPVLEALKQEMGEET